ncbi:S8 family serine peptidase [bacterium]|nr:S8 family serine peptidase [candidate division CSSED10-310 bacterium]
MKRAITILLIGFMMCLPDAGRALDTLKDGRVLMPGTRVPVSRELLAMAEQSEDLEFFAIYTEQADVSGASLLGTKTEKGRYVFERLTETAQRTQADLLNLLSDRGVSNTPFWIQNMILIQGDLAVLELVAARDDIAEIRLNRKYPVLDPLEWRDAYADPEKRAVEWNISQIRADDVWADFGVTGQGIVVMDNDTGVDWDHPALISKYRGWNGSTADHNYNWYDATGTYPTVPNDGHGHGTHTTGTMVGDDGGSNQIGVAPGAKWIAFKNMSNSGSGEDSWFHLSFQWALAPTNLSGSNPDPSRAPHVINNSWGYWGGNDPQFEPDIDNLIAAGVFVEVSAGNEGSSCSSLRSPGDYDNVFTTGATQQGGSIWSSSSRGPSDLYPSIRKPDIVAPGVNIRSSVPGGGYEGGWNGTSMAGPHTCGMVALLWSANSGLIGDIANTRYVIEQTADSTATTECTSGGGVPNNVYGWGELDCYAAVQANVGTPTPSPTGPTPTPTRTPTPSPTPCIWAGFDVNESYIDQNRYDDTSYFYDDGAGAGEVNEDGTLTGWSVRATVSGSLALRIIRPLGGNQYQYVGGSSTVSVSSGINDFPDSLSIDVLTGDLAAIYFPSGGNAQMALNGTGDYLWYYEGDVAGAGTFVPGGNSSRNGYQLVRIYGDCESEPTVTPSQPPTNTPIPSYTPASPTATPVQPTSSPHPTSTGQPTNTPIPTYTQSPPTNTPIPTHTPVPPTATSTVPTGAPTNTPVPPTSTSLPTYTPNPSYTPNPTYTPQPATPTNLPTDTPPPTPDCGELGCSVEMPKEYYAAGDICYCDVIICNPTSSIYTNTPVFVILDVYGTCFFAPSYSTYDYYVRNVYPGRALINVLPRFNWPAGAGSASGIVWYAGMVTPDMTEMIGAMGMFTFGWH